MWHKYPADRYMTTMKEHKDIHFHLAAWCISICTSWLANPATTQSVSCVFMTVKDSGVHTEWKWLIWRKCPALTMWFNHWGVVCKCLYWLKSKNNNTRVWMWSRKEVSDKLLAVKKAHSFHEAYLLSTQTVTLACWLKIFSCPDWTDRLKSINVKANTILTYTFTQISHDIMTTCLDPSRHGLY